MNAPPPKTAERLASICSRLGSQFDGERAAAGLLATRILGDIGLDWRTVIERALVLQPVSASRTPRRFGIVPTEAEDILALYAELIESDASNDWEKRFLADLLRQET